jgi:uncharacterized phage-associated protein
MALSRTAKYYRDNPEARKKRNEYQKKYNKMSREKKKRAELNRLNRLFGTYGNGDGKDVSHKDGRKPRLESASKNRGSKSNTAGDRRARGRKKR